MMIFCAALFQAQGKPTPSAQFPFEFSEGFLWIQVTVLQSKKPLNFLLDTGAGDSVVNLATAKQLGLKLGKRVPVCGVQTMLAGYWPERLSAQVGDFQLPHKYLALDLDKLGKACKRPVDGLIGMDFFRGNIVQIDFAAHVIRILKPEQIDKSDEALPLQVRSDAMCVPITVNRHARQWVRLDTGCATALQWVTSGVETKQCPRRTAIGLAAISIPQTQTTVSIGNQTFQKVPTGLHETAIFPGEAGLLGNGLLSRFPDITIDARAGRVLFQTRGLAR